MKTPRTSGEECSRQEGCLHQGPEKPDAGGTEEAIMRRGRGRKEEVVGDDGINRDVNYDRAYRLL